MKLNVIGVEISEGISHKTGKPVPYSIGQLHCMLPLSSRPMKEGVPGRSESHGAMGATYRVELPILDKLLAGGRRPPFVAEAEMQDVMRYGERAQDIVSVIAVESPSAQRAPARV